MTVDPDSSTGALLKDASDYDYVEITSGLIATTKTFTPDTTQ